MTDIDKVFKKYTSHLKIDKNFYLNIKKFRIRWMNKNSDHIEFLSGNLIGVHPIRFTKDDEDEFFDDLLIIDQGSLKKDLHHLHDIHKERNVTSNVFYITITWLMHEVLYSKFDKESKNRILMELYLVFAYKVFSSLTAWFFKFNLDKDVAAAVYERLSNRYLVKSQGSWQAVFEYRAQDVQLDKGLHIKKLKHFSALECTKIISDLQGRLRSIMKEQYAIVMDVIENNDKRVSTSLSGTDMEGNEVIVEKENLNADYYKYMRHIVFKKEDFIKNDIIEICEELFSNLKPKEFRQTLEYISDLAVDKPELVNDILDTSLKGSIEYLYVTKMYPPYDRRIVSVINLLRGFWSSSKVKDKHVKEIKETLKHIARDATGKNTRWVLITISLVIPIYIFIRAIVKDKYK